MTFKLWREDGRIKKFVQASSREELIQKGKSRADNWSTGHGLSSVMDRMDRHKLIGHMNHGSEGVFEGLRYRQW